MPRAKISDAYGITIELEAGEASYTDLGDKALELLAAATAIVDQRPTRRGGRDIGFTPVKAEREHPGLGNSEP